VIRPLALLGAAALLLVVGLGAWRTTETAELPARSSGSASAAVTEGRSTQGGAAQSGAAPGGAAREGAALFRAKGCASCHDGPDTTALVRGAFPSLADAPAWAADRRLPMSAADYLRQSIREPSAFTSPAYHPGSGATTAMPTLGLSDAEVEAVVAYLLRG
jgi:cytochrome c1